MSLENIYLLSAGHHGAHAVDAAGVQGGVVVGSSHGVGGDGGGRGLQ